jgi:integrase
MTRGYTIKQLRSRTTGRPVGTFTVRWRDASGKVRQRTVASRAAAEELGRKKTYDTDRVRTGLVTPEEQRFAEAGREPIGNHVEALKKDIINRGRVAKYAGFVATRLATVFNRAAIARLDAISPDRVAIALADVAESSSPQTANQYRDALRLFVRWCVRTGRLRHNPLEGLPRLSAPGEVFRRHAFTPEQFEALMQAARDRDTQATAKLDGARRAMMYFVMAHTGFRLRETGSLTPSSFSLADPNDAWVTVAAAYSKHRREDRQPIRPDVARTLAAWLEGLNLMPGTLVFPVRVRGFNGIFKRDCDAAGIPAVAGIRRGTHSLRRFGITSVGRAAGLAVAQQWARHSTPMLTRKYMDLTITDIRKGLDGLPAAEKKDKKRKGGAA